MVAPGIGTMIGSGLGNIAGNVATGQGDGIGGLAMGGLTSGLTAGAGDALGGAKSATGAAWGAAKQAGDIAANQVKTSFGGEMLKGLGLDTTKGRIGFGLNALGSFAQGPNIPTDGGPVEMPVPYPKTQDQPLLQSIRGRGPYIG
jgi:hypothetical protein